MSMLTVLTVIALLLVHVIQGQPADENTTIHFHGTGSSPQEHSSSASSNRDSSMFDKSRSRAWINAGDPISAVSDNSRDGSAASSNVGDGDANFAGELGMPIPTLPGDMVSSSSSIASSTVKNIATTQPSSDSGLAETLVRGTSYPIAYTFASFFLAASTSQQASAPSTFDASSYSAGTVEPLEERPAVEDVKNAALQLSSTAIQAVEVSTGAPSPESAPETHSPPPAATGAASSNEGQTNDNPHEINNDNDPADESSSSSVQQSPIAFALVAVAMAVLVSAVVMFRIRHGQSKAWTAPHATAEAASRRATWTPPVSQIRVIINEQHFAIL